MSSSELFRTEGVHRVMSRGIRVEWDRDQIHAHASAGIRNPIGNALNHLLVHQNEKNAQLVINLVGKALVKLGICPERDCVDVANEAAAWWFNDRCWVCNGKGVIDFEQTQCAGCGGTGKKQLPANEVVRQAIAAITTYHEWTEVQMRKRLA